MDKQPLLSVRGLFPPLEKVALGSEIVIRRIENPLVKRGLFDFGLIMPENGEGSPI